MADPLHARDLILEDARQSRGLILDDEALIEQERELDEDLKQNEPENGKYNSASRRNSIKKGKEREQNDDARDSVDDGRGAPAIDRYGHDRQGSSSWTAGTPSRRAQSGYDAVNGDRYDEDMSYSNGNAAGSDDTLRPTHQSHTDKRRRRQSYSASTPTTNEPQEYQTSSLHPMSHNTSNHPHYHDLGRSHGQDEDDHHHEEPFLRDSINNERRTTERLIGSLLSRDPMKQLESNGNGKGQKLTKKDVRAAYWRSIFISCLFVLAWYLCSTLISLYNKWMFSPEHYGFVFPLFVTSCHMVVQFFLCSLVLSIFPTLRPSNKPKPKDYGTKVLPCGLATALDIGLSNLSLKTITLSFYTMCKSSVLGFVLIWAFIFRLERPTLPLIGIISIIIVGVIMMVSSETQFNLVGMIQVLTASCLAGLRWSLTQILLDKESMGMNNPFATLFWLAPIMGISLAICSIFIEGWFTVFSSQFFDGFDRCLATAGVIILPGVIAFLMNLAEFGLIQRTSVVTLSVAGMFKEVITIFLSTIIFHDELTPINISGLCVALVGIALYNYLKYRNYKIIEKRMLEKGNSSSNDLHNFASRGEGEEGEAEMEALTSSRTRRDHDGGQFQLVGEDDFDSSSDEEESGDEAFATSTKRKQHQGKRLSESLYDNANLDGIERLPAYAETHPNTTLETRQLEEKVNRDPMLLDLEREEERLESEMETTRQCVQTDQTGKSDDLLFDASDGSTGAMKSLQL